jgi:hypothetical protein
MTVEKFRNSLQVWVVTCNSEDDMVEWATTFCQTSGRIPFNVINQGAKPLSNNTVKVLIDNGCASIRDNLNCKCLTQTFNICIQKTTTEFLMLSSDDVIFIQGWVETLADLMDSHDYAGQSYCCVARKEMLERVGGFDENFTYIGWDDCDLFIRMVRAGVPLIYGHSHEWPTDGDRVLKYFIHKEKPPNKTVITYGPENPNHKVFLDKYGKEYMDIKPELLELHNKRVNNRGNK